MMGESYHVDGRLFIEHRGVPYDAASHARQRDMVTYANDDDTQRTLKGGVRLCLVVTS